MAAGAEGALEVIANVLAALTAQTLLATTETDPVVNPVLNRTTIPVSPKFETSTIPADNVHAYAVALVTFLMVYVAVLLVPTIEHGFTRLAVMVPGVDGTFLVIARLLAELLALLKQALMDET
jgi:hypothetical protein